MNVLTAAACAALVSALPFVASAQEAKVAPGVYANLGYADAHSSDADLGAIFGRVGYRFNAWLGLEGEFVGGVNSDNISEFRDVSVSGKAKLSDTEAIYSVGFWPVAPNWDLFGRVGYGHSKVKLEDVTPRNLSPGAGAATIFNISVDDDSWNYGVGAQYHWDGVNGVRADYTRQEFNGHDLDHANVWSIAYSRRF